MADCFVFSEEDLFLPDRAPATPGGGKSMFERV